MPRIEDINQFISTLNSLGHELEVLSERGESLSAVSVPEAGLSADLAELFGDVDVDDGSIALQTALFDDAGSDTPSESEELDAPFDFGGAFEEFENLDNLEDEAAAEGIDEPEDGASLSASDESEADFPAAADEMEDFDLDLDLDLESPQAEPSEDEGPALPEDEGNFAFPEDLSLPDEFEDAAETEEPDSAGETEPAGEDELSMELPDELPDELPADFGMKDLDALGDLGFGEEPAPSEGQNAEGFDLPEEFGFEVETPPPEGESPAGDDDQYSFELPQQDESFEFSDDEISGISPAGPDSGGSPETGEQEDDADIAEDVEEIPDDAFSSDEFSLGDFGAEFGLVGEDTGASGEEPEQPAINIPAGATEAIAAATSADDFKLSDEEFEKLQKALSFLPLNVKLGVEEIIGDNKASDEDQIKLVGYLVANADIKTIAVFTGKLLGRTLIVPKGYEKRTGWEFEAEKDSFAYLFRERILPVLRIVAAAAAVLSLLVFLGYQFIFKPVYAGILYRKGYALIGNERYREGNDVFVKAYSWWKDKSWYFKYADLFIAKHQYRYAEEKYEKILSEYDDYIHPKTGIRTETKKDKYFRRAVLDYASLESEILENFEKAEKVLNRLLDTDMYDYDGLLALGDNYMRWAEFQTNRYDDARKTYGIMLSKFGDMDEIMFRFLEYFISTDNHREVLRLKANFEANKKLHVDPYRYSELAGYLIDKNELQDVSTILMRSMTADERVPEVHYQLARYYRLKEDRKDERTALDNVFLLYGGTQPLSRKQLWRYVDAFNRDGELRMMQKDVIAAEKSFKEGIKRYEEGVRKKLLKKNPELGRIYVNLGEISYYLNSDFDEAYQQFLLAEDSFVRDPAVSYKKGFILFRREEYDSALKEFSKVEESFPAQRNLLFAMGNTLYERKDFFAAQGYYLFLQEKLEGDRRRIRTLEPRTKQSDRAVVLNTMKLYNNLGIVFFKLGQRTQDPEMNSRALVYLTDSSEMFENFSRDPETLVRGETKNLAYLNMRQILYPSQNYSFQIYHPIPLDLTELEY